MDSRVSIAFWPKRREANSLILTEHGLHAYLGTVSWDCLVMPLLFLAREPPLGPFLALKMDVAMIGVLLAGIPSWGHQELVAYQSLA